MSRPLKRDSLSWRLMKLRLWGALLGISWSGYAQAEPSSEETSETQLSTEGEGLGSESSSEPLVNEPLANEPGTQPDSQIAPLASGTPAEHPEPSNEQPPALIGPGAQAEPAPAQSPPARDYEGYSLETEPRTDGLEIVKPPALFQVALLWNGSLPLGSSSEFVDQLGIPGASVEVQLLALAPIRFGALVAWHTISQKEPGLFQDGPVAVSGLQVRELSGNHLQARVHYVLGEKKPAQGKAQFLPYVAAGLGGARSVRRVDIGIDRVIEEGWHFVVAPEAGLELPLGPVTVIASARLNYLFQAGNNPEQMYLNFNLGVGLE